LARTGNLGLHFDSKHYAIAVGNPEITPVTNLSPLATAMTFYCSLMHKAAEDARRSEQLTVAGRSSVEDGGKA
jgi:hypothetical protein